MPKVNITIPELRIIIDKSLDGVFEALSKLRDAQKNSLLGVNNKTQALLDLKLLLKHYEKLDKVRVRNRS